MLWCKTTLTLFMVALGLTAGSLVVSWSPVEAQEKEECQPHETHLVDFTKMLSGLARGYT